MIGGFQSGPFQPAFQQEVTANTGAGKSKRRRYVVEIDGELFHVDSEAQARALLDRAEVLAVKTAKAAAAIAVRKNGTAPKAPPILADAPALAAVVNEAREALRAIYERAYADALDQARKRRKRRDDDDDEDTILLLM